MHVLYNSWSQPARSQLQILFCACVACHTVPAAQQAVEQLSSCGGPSPHAPSLKTPAVSSVDLSDIPEGTLGEWLCKHTMMTSCYIEYSDFTHLQILILFLC